MPGGMKQQESASGDCVTARERLGTCVEAGAGNGKQAEARSPTATAVVQLNFRFQHGAGDPPLLCMLGDKYQPASARSQQHPPEHPGQPAKQVHDDDEVAFRVCSYDRGAHFPQCGHLPGGVRMLHSGIQVWCLV